MTRAELVTHLREVLEIIPPEIAGDGALLTQHISDVTEARFPGVPAALVLEALRVIRFDNDAVQEDEIREHARLTEVFWTMIEMRQRHAISEDTPMGEALRLMADRGEPAAISFLAQTNNPAYRSRVALVMAAMDAHPAWSRNGEEWVLDGDASAPVTDDDLVDWYQRTHPREARAIGDAVAASLPGRDPDARQAWSLAMIRASGDDAPMIGTSMAIITMVEEAEADFLEMPSPILANLPGLDADALEGVLRRLEDLGAIIRSPAGIHLVPPPPDTSAVERALDLTLAALLDHRTRQERQQQDQDLSPAGFVLLALRKPPTRAESALQALLRDPVEHALGTALADLGRHLFDLTGTVEGMREACDRVADLDPARASCRVSILDAAWDGIGRGDERWWR